MTTTYVPLLADIYVEERWYVRQINDNCWALIREIHYVVQLVYYRVIARRGYDDPGVQKIWTAESKGLCVLVHGLSGHPSIWEPQLERLREEKNIDLFVPYVPLGGNGEIEEVARPILERVKEYANKNPGRPICFMGVSNGGRICTYSETELRKVSSAPVRVSTIAAVHFGTSRMDWVRWFGLRLGYNPVVVKDLCFGSDKAKEILLKVAEVADAPREYEFFATTEDTQVPEIVSAIPDVGSYKCTRHIVHGYGHNSIVAGVAHHQIDSWKMWMQKVSATTAAV